MISPKPWAAMTPAEKIEAVIPLHAKGMTSKAMAAALGAPSRNAIVAVVYRQRRADRVLVADVVDDDPALIWADRSAESKRRMCVSHARAGLSNEAIAEKLGAPSPHSVAGVLRDAKFYGAALPSRRTTPKPKPKPKPKVTARAPRGIVRFAKPPIPDTLPPVDRAAAFEPLPGTTPIPFADNTGCKWPVDGRDGKGLLCCGTDRPAGKPYCEEHRRLSSQAA